VGIHGPVPSPAVAAQCSALVQALPDTVDGEDRRDVAPADALGAAWGDPAIVLSCGVDRPAALRRSSSCFVVDGVGWLATRHGTEVTGSDQAGGTLTFTTIGRSAYVELSVPDAYQPQADPLAAVASAVSSATDQTRPCQ
jgi:hypothetical protein